MPGVQVTGDTTLLTGDHVRLENVVWDDLRIVPSAFDFAGGRDPALADWRPGGSGTTFKVWEFTTNDQAFFTCQIPHSYKPGTSLKPHVHWTPGDRGTAETVKTVAWKLDYAVANIDGTLDASANVDLTDTCTGTNDKHEISLSGTIPGTGLTISAMLVCRIYRDAGDSWATNTAGNCPILLEIDFHFEIDRLGSDNETSND
jgi:hypothetical protein